jgi:hypothetical protein
MNEQQEERLTTSDMAAAAQPRSAEQGTRSEHVEGEERRVESPAAGPTAAGQAQQASAQAAPLFSPDEAQGLRTRWDAVQTAFVDEPRRAVEQADELVAQVMKRLAEIFAAERTNLESQWGQGDNVSTEDLRVALQRYRSFFDRLLSV